MEEYELGIVGAGPTGLFATFCAGLREINSITLEGLENTGGQVLKFYPIKDVLDIEGIPKIKGMDLAASLLKQAETFNNKIVTNSKVTDIKSDAGKFILEVNGSDAYSVKAILLCTGIGSLFPTKLNADGEEAYAGKGVYYSVNALEPFKNKKVAVVGGGDSGFDLANQISSVVDKIYILEYGTAVKAAERSVADLKGTGKAEIMTDTEVKEISGDGQTVRKIQVLNRQTNSETTLDISAVIVAIGHKTETNTFKSIKFDTFANKLEVDDNYSTSIPGIYAAGDACTSGNRPKMGLLAVGGSEAYMAINSIKKYLNPSASIYGEHSTNLKL